MDPIRSASLHPQPEALMTASTRSLTSNWSFRQVGTDKWYTATVPGCNFTDLLYHGLIPDPFYRDNEKRVQWIEGVDWEYKSCFTCTDQDLEWPDQILRFEGLDTFATVYLNGQIILETENMFRAYEVAVGQYLKVGDNDLLIRFDSPINKVAERADAAGFTYPAGNDHSDHKRSVFCRKAPYHFGWDWGPRLVTSGIWRPVYLVPVTGARIRYASLSTLDASGEKATIQSEWEVEAGQAEEVNLSLDIGDGRWFFEEKVFLRPGRNLFTFLYTLDHPQRWWPAGYGTPYLYKVQRRLAGALSLAEYKPQKLGIRTIKLVREPDAYGHSFYFRVNGMAVFSKGANYIPQDNFLNRVTPDHYRKMIQNAIAANMNMLRVWGGGIYEDDLFYEEADQAGLLIWQDFMFGCSMYPGDPDFLNNVQAEAIYNVKRLKHHACLALWCGNNEIAVGWKHWGWQEEYGYNQQQCDLLVRAYKALFENLLPEVVQANDPVHDYVPTSPLIDYSDLDHYQDGDVHYWGVWHEEKPFHTFLHHIPRFMSEYGFQSFPTLPTLNKYAIPEDWGLETAVMQVHQKHPRGNGIIRKYLLQSFVEPIDFPSFLYVSQVLQAQGIRMAIEAHRAAKPFCMGTLYWQLNDCWPVASWSGIDYYGEWKAMHYAVREAYRETILAVNIQPDHWTAHLISDYPIPRQLDVEVALHHLSVGRVAKVNRSFGLSAKENVAFDLKALYKAIDEGEWSSCYLSYQVSCRGEVLYTNHCFLVATKELDLMPPEVQINCTTEAAEVEISVKSNVLVKNMYLWVEGQPCWFSDNFFDLFPGEERTLFLRGVPPEHFTADQLSWTSIYQTYSPKAITDKKK